MASRYYSDQDMVCHCCGQLPPYGVAQSLYDLLDAMCDNVGYKLSLNCAYRCNYHNAQVGGVPGSQHNADPCEAADIDASNIGVDNLAAIAIQCGADGIGYYYSPDDLFVHVDTRNGRVGSQITWQG